MNKKSLWVLAVALSSLAIGPRNVTTSGIAVKWVMPVTVHVETDLDVDGKDVEPLVEEALSAWQDLSDSNVVFTRGSLGTAVDDTNICPDFFFDASACPTGSVTDGWNPLVIDEDGTIVADFFGLASRFTTLGFASIISYDTTTGEAVKGEAVFNASCLSGVELPGCATAVSGGLSFSDDDFTSFIVHELGHFLGLDHQQVNLTEATDSDDTNDYLITTMFPTFIVGNGADFKTPERDDAAAAAQLYPEGSFASSTWTIEGTVFETDGTTELQCANLVARNVSDPRVDALSAISGDLAPARTADGSFEIVGLTAGATYTIDLEPIGSGFTGASGYTPCRGSSGESAPASVTAATSANTFTASGGETVTVICTDGIGCELGSGGGGGGGASSGGCNLVP